VALQQGHTVQCRIVLRATVVRGAASREPPGRNAAAGSLCVRLLPPLPTYAIPLPCRNPLGLKGRVAMSPLRFRSPFPRGAVEAAGKALPKVRRSQEHINSLLCL